LIPRLIASGDGHVINVISIAGSEVYDYGAGVLDLHCTFPFQLPTIVQVTPVASTPSAPSAKRCG
jgi:hypothetical protein